MHKLPGYMNSMGFLSSAELIPFSQKADRGREFQKCPVHGPVSAFVLAPEF